MTNEVWLSSYDKSIKFFSEKNFIFDQSAISINDSNTIKHFELKA
jgi:hypothetical protein